MTETENVVLLDDDGQPIGTAPKTTVHGAHTPLHLAFSCHVLGRDGRVLVTRRALSKLTWPGVWTNAFCGHPGPGEPMLDAVRRRAEHELGIALSGIELALPDFRYHAIDAGGIVENEVCPVYLARTDDQPRLNPHEVADAHWAEPTALAAAITATPWVFSPWLVLQSRELPLLSAAQPG